jgi:hypothetical protein
MTLRAKPVQMLLAVVIAVVLGPTIGAMAAFLVGFGMYAADGYWWDLSPGSLLAGLRMLVALIIVGYLFAAKIALVAGLLVALWIFWRPPTLGIAVAAALIASCGYALISGVDTMFKRDAFVTIAASVIAAAGCWFLTRRFVRVA